MGRLDPTAAPPICVLLLSAPLERFALRDVAEELSRARGIVVVDPPRVGYDAHGHAPDWLLDAVAARQARRLVRALRRRRGLPRVVVMFSAAQYRLARAVLAESPQSELWYWRVAPAPDDAGELDDQATRRAALVVGDDEPPDPPLLRRLTALGIDVSPRPVR